jgi:hypothetical protein
VLLERLGDFLQFARARRTQRECRRGQVVFLLPAWKGMVLAALSPQ